MASADDRIFIPVPDIDETRRALVQLATVVSAATGAAGFLWLWFVLGHTSSLVVFVPAVVWVLVVFVFGLRSDFRAQAAQEARCAAAVFGYAADVGGRVDLPDSSEGDPSLWGTLIRAGVVVDGHGHRFRIGSASIDGTGFVALDPAPNLETVAVG